MNLVPPGLLGALLAQGANLTLKTFKMPVKFGLAAQTTPKHDHIHIECDREVTVSIELRIRHGKSLNIRNVVWMGAISQVPVPEPLLGRPLLEALGLDTKETLAAACDKYEGSVDAKEIMNELAYANGSIARILDTGIYHSDNAVEEDGTEDIDWLDLGQDTKEELDSAMMKVLD